jgi:hypothetical protein
MSKVFSVSAQASKASAEETLRRWTTLRHWTTSNREFVGGRQRPGPGLADREPADGCRLNLIATKLKSIQAEIA